MTLNQGMTRKELIDELLKIGEDTTPVHFLCGITGEPFPWPHIEPAREVETHCTRSGKTFEDLSETPEQLEAIVFFMED